MSPKLTILVCQRETFCSIVHNHTLLLSNKPKERSQSSLDKFLLICVITEMFYLLEMFTRWSESFFFFNFYVPAQKMNPGILGLAMQQRQEKERLRCKQGLLQQTTPQVRGQNKAVVACAAGKASLSLNNTNVFTSCLTVISRVFWLYHGCSFGLE